MLDPMPKLDIKTPPTLSEAMLLTRIEELEAKLAKAVEIAMYRDQFVPIELVYCRGDKCRNPWCASCFEEERAEKELNSIIETERNHRTNLAELTGGKDD